MHKHCPTSVLDPKLTSEEEETAAPNSKLNRRLMEEMVQKYFSYAHASDEDDFYFQRPKPSAQEPVVEADSEDESEDSSSELAEGHIHTPLRTQCKFSGISGRGKTQQTKQSPTSQRANFVRVQPALSRNVALPKADCAKGSPKLDSLLSRDKVTVFFPARQQRYVLHIQRASQSPPAPREKPFIMPPGHSREMSTCAKTKEGVGGFIKEMRTRGLEKEIMRIDTLNNYINDELGRSPKCPVQQRNYMLLASNSSQSTAGSSSQLKVAAGGDDPHCARQAPNSPSASPGMTFPYQRRNRSVSPDKNGGGGSGSGDLSGLGKSPKPPHGLSPKPSVDSLRATPVLANKSFMFGSQARTEPRAKDESVQILKMLNREQEGKCEKQYIIDDIEDNMPEETRPVLASENANKESLHRQHEMMLEQPLEKMVPAPPAVTSIKAPLKGKHRRVTSQVIDKQTLKRLLFTNNSGDGTMTAA